ncbi:unnamed protein product [Pleuronectes platessa]|uniref:Uncharacterized protein n=1 Tax=Pleuronectes platessa TaxID=8262 RepID=A0A9N7ZAK8_PLEPL|nr:unnamed protein product [Pleuronectes platessa]
MNGDADRREDGQTGSSQFLSFYHHFLSTTLHASLYLKLPPHSPFSPLSMHPSFFPIYLGLPALTAFNTSSFLHPLPWQRPPPGRGPECGPVSSAGSRPLHARITEPDSIM